MRVFVFTYDRVLAATTSRMLEAESVSHSVLCHNEEQAEAFAAAGTVKARRLIPTGQPKGLSFNRNAALNMMTGGEWALFLVDDLKSVTELSNCDTAPDPLPITYANQKEYTKRFSSPVSMTKFLDRAEQLAHRCDRDGVLLGGWTSNANTPFRKRRFGRNVFVDGRAIVVKKSALRFDEATPLMDDYSFTAVNIAHGTGTLIDRWLLPDCARYTPGGYGSIAERAPQKISECAYLVDKYPALFAYRAKAGQPDGSHIVLRPQSRKPAARKLS